MRTAHKVWIGIAAVVFAIVAVTDLSSTAPPPATRVAAPQVSAAPASPVAAAPTSPVAAPAGPVQGWGRVTRVIDGDTFQVGPDTVRVLGIDSCEAGTYGGQQATETARSELLAPNTFVIVTPQPGVDRDRYGRMLRYVQVAVPYSRGYDFGTSMVGYDHTGIYQGQGDASPAYVARLRARDPDGRDCAEPDPVPTTSPTPDVDSDDDGDVNLPDGALTGGYCGRKWWC